MMNELVRLRELDSYQILDTLPDNEFNEIVELASAICNTPASMITFIDSNRQWFKARVGIDFQETPRELNFCEATFNNPNEVLVINDMTKDDRFHDHPLVCNDPNVRFYAGAPLQTPNGYVLGTLCILDDKPRTISEKETRALKLLSDKVMKLLELRKEVLNQRHQLEMSAKLLKKLTDQAPGAIYQMEMKPDGTVSFPFVSKGIRSIHPQLSADKLALDGCVGLKVVHPEDISELKTKLALSKSNLSIWDTEFRIQTGDGQSKWIRTQASPELRDDGAVVWYGTFQDVSESRNYMETLEQIIFDISHGMRRPAVLVLGLVNAIDMEELNYESLKEYAGYFKSIANDMDKYTVRINKVYQAKKDIAISNAQPELEFRHVIGE